MNRREFCQISASAAALLPWSSAGRAALIGPQWETAVGLNGFAYGRRKYQANYPIWESWRFCLEAGFQEIELVDGWLAGGCLSLKDRERSRVLRELYDRAGLQIFSLWIGVGGAVDPDAARRQA
ncbi:MAG: hypothetical protein M2R45_05004 [Verrucomicrobia subdivision 3 bacterium]|nr:hypothetical protein [Limisphaerales bacterium]MCS1415601.1 hypothetical protein [Limisphaerales bacterium]